LPQFACLSFRGPSQVRVNQVVHLGYCRWLVFNENVTSASHVAKIGLRRLIVATNARELD
ncbi:hypothetical protein AB6G07_20525, partial [Providencia stuartii]|uniref:hypothetical protein n=1 Tax=Providencia stuartii TaxID=588 RepID=UPI0034DD82B6